MPFSLTVTVEDLRDVLGLHRRVQDALRLDDDERAPLAEAVAPRRPLPRRRRRASGVATSVLKASITSSAPHARQPVPAQTLIRVLVRVQVREKLFPQLIERLE